jgi:hypothetical protein
MSKQQLHMDFTNHWAVVWVSLGSTTVSIRSVDFVRVHHTKNADI